MMRVILVLLISSTLLACGQKGPLYLPDDGAKVKVEKKQDKEKETKKTKKQEINNGSF